jgi:hypothetical protein
MRLSVGVLLGLMFATGAHAQSADRKPLTPQQYRVMMDDIAYWQQEGRRYERIRKRARELYPGRRDTPLRDLNISDGEVREVQTIAARYLPRALVNISPVVGECPCEEGPNCTAQVYVLATDKGQTSGLQLSRTKEAWDVSVVQKWWLKRNAVQRQNTGNSFRDDYLAQKAQNDLLEEFPVCAGQVDAARKTAAATNTEGKTEGTK